MLFKMYMKQLFYIAPEQFEKSKTLYFINTHSMIGGNSWAA